MGGQTGLNTALELEAMGILEKFGVEMIGAKRRAIEMAEDRALFREAMERLGLENPKAAVVTAPYLKNGKVDLAEGVRLSLEVLNDIGLPAIIRPAFTLGGTGGGVAYNLEDYEYFCKSGMDASPANQILIDESLLGWKEFEMEVVRDAKDNAIIVCSIENVDPMGVHTGDSITVAPALTLTDKEYQMMRTASIDVLREIGVETGGSNVQWAVNPSDGRMVVIEMNPRVSRSSALASKATGFPIAKIAAKLAIGYTLDELENDITKVTPASFEPTIDYVVTKIPRFAFEKFPGAKPHLTTAMKSVGEVMAIGRSFHESIQKALCSLETELSGFDEIDIPNAPEKSAIIKALSEQTPDRIRVIAQAMRFGLSNSEIHEVTMYDSWFLERIREIVEMELEIRQNGLPIEEDNLRQIKSMGFSDSRLATLSGKTEEHVRDARKKLKVDAVFKRIDTCAAEFEAQTPYMYSTYEAPMMGTVECEAEPSNLKKIVILGGGPNRIGQGIEFDYCCCHACYALADAGFETIMVNCNPETVSTDYDTSDRLYFEPLTFEHVLEILRKELKNGSLVGVIVQFGGQTPLKLAKALEAEGIPILGTSPDAIDLAEDRERFQKLVYQLGLRQPNNGIANSDAQAFKIAKNIGFPLVIRPSYVLGGRAMEIVRDLDSLKRYITEAVVVSGESPVLLDSYLEGAIECDVDAISDGDKVHVAGIMQHIEEAGVHSGDSACSLPPYSLDSKIIKELNVQTEKLAKALKVVGLMNVQFAVKDNQIYLIEVNPRASRTVPFVAKATDSAIASIAARIMAGETLDNFNKRESYGSVSYNETIPLADPMSLADPMLPWFSVKEAVMPFARFPGVDTILGPEMRSTGEVMGWDRDFGRAFLKAQIGAGMKLPNEGCVFFSIKDKDKNDNLAETAQRLIMLGFNITATRGTAAFLKERNIPCKQINKVYEGRPNIVDTMKNGEIDLVMNTTEGTQAVKDSREIRSVALYDKIPYFTTAAAAHAAALAIESQTEGEIEVKSLQN
jgi:carbamoyl-phosphate synthase large subunit